MTQSAVCFHCSEPIPKGNHFQLTINQKQADFCCPACLAISQTIHTAGLDDYYLQRSESASKAQTQDFSCWDNISLQQAFVSNYSNEELQTELYIEGMHCTACAWLIEQHLSNQTGITLANVNYQEQKLTLRWQQQSHALSGIMQAINNIGYIPHPYQQDQIQQAQKLQSKKQLTRIGITALLMMQIVMLAIGLYAGDFLGIRDEYRHLLGIASLAFSLPLLYFSALPFFSSAFLALRQGHLNMDFNISLAIIGLYGSSIYSVYSRSGDIYFDSVAMLCLFISIARYIELKSRQKLQTQQGLLPKTATLILPATDTDNGVAQHKELPLTDINAGDTLLIKAGETVALDGIVTSGSSSVSEAFINGESQAIVKQCGDTVFAGSQNHDGLLHVEVTATSSHCLVNKITELSKNNEKPRIEVAANHIASIFTAVVLVFSIITYLFWFLRGSEEAFWIALSVLVISCPCALSLAAPTALSAIQYRLRQQGLLIRSAHVLTSIDSIDHVIFDKTGTLTCGELKLKQQKTLGPRSAHIYYDIASSLESFSNHPISHAFTSKALQAKKVELRNAEGIIGQVEGQSYRLGSPSFCQQWLPNITIPNTQNMLIGLCNQQQLLAWFELEDAIRPQAFSLSQQLQKMQFTLHIFSGDSSHDVQYTAEQLGITDYHQGCSPEQKLNLLKSLQNNGAKTLMMGDGINDAPVLSQSHISVAFFHSSDWLKNSADIILLNNDLTKIYDLLTYTKAFKHIYWQNFSWALIYNGLAIPFAMAGWVSPMIAAIGMSLSSVIVVLNSQRLLNLRRTELDAIAEPKQILTSHNSKNQSLQN